MRKILITGIIAVTLLVSCKSKQTASQAVAAAVAEEDKTAKEIITGHYNNPANYKTLVISADVAYKDAKNEQDVSAEIRILKDQKILVIVRYAFVTMAKALITPEEVSYYEILNSTYFKGDYKLLSRWLGTELDYNKVQNLLTGRALYDLNQGGYKSSIENGLYKLTGKSTGLQKDFLFEGDKYLLKQQLIVQNSAEPRTLQVDYPGYQDYTKAVLPAGIKIQATQKDKVDINIGYTAVKFDENLTFPYSIPGGYEQISVD
jgi:Domain of unknown function (DUF4292)